MIFASLYCKVCWHYIFAYNCSRQLIGVSPLTLIFQILTSQDNILKAIIIGFIFSNSFVVLVVFWWCRSYPLYYSFWLGWLNIYSKDMWFTWLDVRKLSPSTYLEQVLVNQTNKLCFFWHIWFLWELSIWIMIVLLRNLSPVDYEVLPIYDDCKL
jgi:hypothetical protein